MCKNYKQGVSLITVLLFMVVATIGATGVFRWLTSQNKASASRLMQSEVYQASAAGLETARSWMVYHAPDVGALIGQYEQGDRKPILLDSILRPLAKDKKQEFSVYLVGADTKSYPYKVKLISTGKSRGGSKYSQIAILTVDGLYKVQIPKKESKLNFNYSFWGANLKFAGTNQVTSLVLNGDWDNNPPTISGDFIVTGSLTLSGDNAVISGNTCVGKDLQVKNAIGPFKDVYVHQNFPDAQGTFENLYVKGNLKQENKKVTVNQNMTINGTLTTNLGGQEFEIMGNLVLGPTGVLYFDSENNPFTVHKNVWIPYSNGITGAGTNYRHYLGMDPGAELHAAGVTYQSDAGTHKNYKASSNTTFKSTSDNKGVSGDPPTGAEAAKDYCDAIWLKEPGCGGLQFIVEDKLVTSFNTFKDKAVSTSTCPGLKTKFENGNQMVTTLNACYKNLRDNQPDLLYNGFLVVKMTSGNLGGFTEILEGNFVLIVEDDMRDQRLPATTSDSKVMLYLTQGSSQMIQRSKCESTSYYNYFIYSFKTVAQLNGFDATCPIKGTIYLPLKNPDNGSLICDYGTTLLQNNTQLEFNPVLLEELAKADIICDAESVSCGSGEEGSPSNPTLGSSGFDSYYIPTSPRLRLTLESQYVNKELDPDTLSSGSFAKLNPSILVMPRTIYLPKNAKGTLNQYYSVLNLNGATEVQGSGSVSCTPSTGLSTSGDLAGSVGNIYRCDYSPGNAAYNTCPFYVVVDGSEAEKSKISFTEAYTDVTPESNASVFLKVVDGAEEISTYIQVTIPSGWVVVPKAGVTSIGTNMYQATFTPVTGNSTIHLFEVDVGTTGSASFTLVSPIIGAEPSNPLMQSLEIAGSATIERQGISEYLAKYPAASDKGRMDILEQHPPCGSYATGVWVDADGIGCTTISANNNWVCGVSNAITLVPKVFPAEACVFVLPADNNKIDPPEDNKSYTLYADLKRRSYTLTVKSPNAPSKVVLQDSTGSPKDECSLTAGASCGFQVFYGDKYKVVVSKKNTEDKFSYWKCLSGSGGNCAVPSFSGSTYEIIPLSNDTLIAYFNQRDNCFNESFQGLSENCTGAQSQRCIDKCAAGISCYVNAGAYSTTADWIMTHANNGAEFKKPKIVDHANQKAYLGNAEKPTFILKPVPAGYNGVYAAQIRTYPKNQILSSQSLNTGLVFRSNAAGTSYFSLSILSKKNDNTNLIRVCYATQPNITDESRCLSSGNAVSSWVGTNLDEVKTHTVKATLNGNSLTVFVVDEYGSVYINNTVFDLSASQFGATGVSAGNNEYVGFKLYGDHFRYYNLSWSSNTYACADEPQLYCSFGANYAGGQVPLNTQVTPWAYVTNYCQTGDASCCDYTFNPPMPRSFSTSGYQDASTVTVSASCNNGVENRPFDAVPCGGFFVGKRTDCAEDVNIKADQSCYGAGLCEMLLASSSNMRDASLKLNLTIPNLPDTISVYLMDAMGIQSAAGAYLTASGSYTIPIKDFVDVDMFDPENVAKVLFKSAKSNTFQVKDLYTDCPNSVHISSCLATYEPGKLKFSASVENALSCSISGTGISTISGISCNNPWAYTHDDIYLNSDYEGQTGSWTITAHGMDGVTLATCATSAEIKGVTGACSWSPTTLTSTVAGTSQFTANFTNCPTGGCVYQIKDNVSAEAVVTGTGTTGTADFTTPKAVGSYTYSAHVNEKKLCEASLNVVAGSPAFASCGGVASDGKFTASVTDTNKVGWTWKVVVTDYLGNVLHTSPVSGAQTGNGSIAFTGYNPSVAGSYTYSLFLNGSLNSVCNSSLTVAGSITNCSLTRTTINSGEHVTFYATTDKVADGTSCVIKRPDGTEDPSVSTTINNNSCSAAFYPSQAGVYSVDIGDYNEDCGTVTINGGTSCEYQSSWCNGMPIDQVQGNISNYTNNNESTQNCIFIVGVTDSTIFNGLNKTGILVNGVQADLHYNNSWLASNVTKADGGYYFYYPKNTGWSQISNAATGIPNCEAPVIPSSSSVVPSSSSVVVSSSSGGTTITLTHGGAGYDFAPGTYNIGCTNGDIVCGADGLGKTLSNSNGGGCSSANWWTLSNMTTGCGSCPGATITVTGGTMKCKNDW